MLRKNRKPLKNYSKHSILFHLHIYPLDSQESDRGAYT